MEDIQFNPATPEKPIVPVHAMQQATPPSTSNRKITFKVREHYDAEVSPTPSSHSTETTTTRVLTKRRLGRYKQSFDADRERQRTQEYLDKFTDPAERSKKVLNMIHSMYPSNEAFHTARHPFYDPDEHGYYDDFVRDRMYEGKRGDHDDDQVHEDDPRINGHEVWEPQIGDDGIDTQEDLDMVLSMQSRHDRFFDNIDTTKIAQREAARLAREREPAEHQQQEGENGAECKSKSLIFGNVNKSGKQVVWPLILVRSERNAHHIVPGRIPNLPARDVAHLKRLEAEGEPGLLAIIRQEEALWYERKWRQGIVVPRDEDGNIGLHNLSRELEKHVDRAKRYWYRELRWPKGDAPAPAATPTPAPSSRETPYAGKQARRGRPPKNGSSPSACGHGRGRGRGRRPGRGLGRRHRHPEAAYDPSKDAGGDSSDGGTDYKPRARSTRKRQYAGTDGAGDVDVDDDAVMAGGSSDA